VSDIRAPFLVLAVVVLALVVLVEIGSSAVVGGGSRVSDLGAQAAELDVEVEASNVTEPPGRGIAYLALIDVVLLYSMGLMAVGLVAPERILGRVQGVVTLIGSIVLIIVALIMAIIAFVELLVMVTLFTAAPFGTIAYLAIWGFFPRGDAAALLALLMFLKLVALGCLVLAHQRFLRFKRLLVLVATSLICQLLVAFLHGLVPIVLVAIVDNIAAIVIAIVAIIWAIVLLIGSIFSIVSSLRATASRM
jgi:hypothetical protein